MRFTEQPVADGSPRWPVVAYPWWAALFGLLWSVLLASRLAPPFWNTFPFLTADALDVVYEGIALAEWWRTGVPTVLPVLRTPVFVTLSTLDALWSAHGLLLVAAQGLGYFLQLLALGLFARRLGTSPAAFGMCLLIFLLCPIGHFRAYLIPDNLAIGFALLGWWAVGEYQRDGRWRTLMTAVGLTSLGGLTQIYAIFPAGVALGYGVWSAWRSGRHPPLPVILAGLAVLGIVALAGSAWRYGIPHVLQPVHWGLLGWNIEILHFNFGIWSLLWVPAGIGLALVVRRPADPEAFGLATVAAIVVACMVGLLFFYGWTSSRFSLMPFAVFTVLLIALAPGRQPSSVLRPFLTRLGALAAVFFVFSTLLAPRNFHIPNVRDMVINPYAGALGLPILTEIDDRLAASSHCGRDVECREGVNFELLGQYGQVFLRLLDPRTRRAASLPQESGVRYICHDIVPRTHHCVRDSCQVCMPLWESVSEELMRMEPPS